MSLITTHIADAKARLLEQFKGKPNFEAFIESLVNGLQDLEYVLDDLLNKRLNIDLTEGAQLDRLGNIVGVARGTLTDVEYRVRIRAKIVQNLSQGEPERIITVMSLLLSGSRTHLQELFPASIGVMNSVDVPADQVDTFFQNIKLVTPAGVRIDFFGYFDETEGFSFDGPVTDAYGGLGFGDATDAMVGGIFAKLHQPTVPQFAMDGDDLAAGGFGTYEDPLVGGLFISA